MPYGLSAVVHIAGKTLDSKKDALSARLPFLLRIADAQNIHNVQDDSLFLNFLHGILLHTRDKELFTLLSQHLERTLGHRPTYP